MSTTGVVASVLVAVSSAAAGLDGGGAGWLGAAVAPNVGATSSVRLDPARDVSIAAALDLGRDAMGPATSGLALTLAGSAPAQVCSP